MRQQRHLNLFQRNGDISGIETHIMSVQHVATLRRMTKDAAQDRVRDALTCRDTGKQLS